MTATHGWIDRKGRYLAHAALLLGVLGGSCDDGVDAASGLDSIGQRESRECPQPHEATAMAIFGHYDDMGVRIDYDRVVKRKTEGNNKSKAYTTTGLLGDVVLDPRKIEQVYHDGMQGDGRAIWLGCQMDVAARSLGRMFAKKMAELQCQTVFNCQVHFDRLPFSPNTASGVRLAMFLGDQFTDMSEQLRLDKELILGILQLYLGATITRGVLARRSGVGIASTSGGASKAGKGGKAGKSKAGKGNAGSSSDNPKLAKGNGPGEFVRVNESMSERARSYQERVTGERRGQAYRVEIPGKKADFDGYQNGLLIEAKGPGYATFIREGKFEKFFSGNKGMFKQAETQNEIAKATGCRVEWRVAEKELADLLGNAFKKFDRITVVHRPL